MLSRKLLSLKQENFAENTDIELVPDDQAVSVETQIAASSNELPEESTDDVMTSEEASFLLYEQGRYSPILLSPSEVPSDQVVTHAQACTGLIMAQSRVMRGEQAVGTYPPGGCAPPTFYEIL